MGDNLVNSLKDTETTERKCSGNNLVFVVMQSEYWAKIVKESLNVFAEKNSLSVMSEIPVESMPEFSSYLSLLGIASFSSTLSLVVLDSDSAVGIDETLRGARESYQGPIMVCGWDAKLKTNVIEAGADVFVQKYGNRPRMIQALKNGIDEAVIYNSRIGRGNYVSMPVVKRSNPVTLASGCAEIFTPFLEK